jgi:hypothetical protein
MSYAVPPLIASDADYTDGIFNGSLNVFGNVSAISGTVNMPDSVSIGSLSVTSLAVTGPFTANSLSVTSLSVSGPLNVTGIFVGTATLSGVTSVTVSTVAATSTSHIFVSAKTAQGSLSVSSQTTGSFTISATTVDGTCAWLVLGP